MRRKIQRHAAGIAYAVTNAPHQVQVMRLQGERSLPVWAMPIIGLPDVNSSRRQAEIQIRSR